VHTLLFLDPKERPAEPALRKLSPAEGTSRLFVNALNAAAHPAFGVDALVRIARQASCYELTSSDLDATCELIRSVVDV
jgi:hypothetical protein